MSAANGRIPGSFTFYERENMARRVAVLHPPGKIRTVKRIYRHRPKAIEGESNSFIFSFPGVTRKGTRRTTETKKRTTNANARGKRGRGSFPETHLEHAGGASDLVHVLHDDVKKELDCDTICLVEELQPCYCFVCCLLLSLND